MVILVISAIALALSSVGPATIPASLVYLTCTTKRRDSVVDWKLTLNEQAGVVDVSSTANNGYGPNRVTATFSAESVIFLGFTLSRIDLKMTRHVFLGGVDLGVESGDCQLVTPPKRAF